MDTFIYLRTHHNFDYKSGKNIFRKENLWTLFHVDKVQK